MYDSYTAWISMAIDIISDGECPDKDIQKYYEKKLQ